MKKVLFFLCMIALGACTNDSSFDNEFVLRNEEQTSTKGMLTFSNEESFKRTIDSLSVLTTNSEKKRLVKKLFPNFKSLVDVYDLAMEEAAELDESESAFVKFKEKYQKYLYFADYKDDCGPYLPVSDLNKSFLLDANGNVIISGKIVNMKDIDSYNKLQATGRAMYDKDFMPLTRGWSSHIDYHPEIYGKGSSYNVGQEFDSGWWVQSRRKIRLKCGRQVVRHGIGYQMRLHVEVSFRKKTWLGWSNYASKTTTTGTFTGGCNGSINHYEHAWSSHDWYQTIPFGIVNEPVNDFFRADFLLNPPITANLKIDFRGIGGLTPLTFTIAGVKVLMPNPIILP